MIYFVYNLYILLIFTLDIKERFLESIVVGSAPLVGWYCELATHKRVTLVREGNCAS